MLEILYSDSHYVAINKPHGLLVHRSKIAADADVFALQLLRDQLQKKVFPVHRIDRKTAGVLLFAFDKESLAAIQKQFAEHEGVQKRYLAIVRGFVDDSGTVDYALSNDDGKLQDAVTNYKCLAKAELPLPSGKFETSRYSLVQAEPVTGRMHQIRKHFAHIFHPIIGDRPHGCNKQNRMFKERFAMNTMMLHARELIFEHPFTGDSVKIQANLSDEFKRVMDMMGWVDCK